MKKPINFIFLALLICTFSQSTFSEAHDILLDDLEGNQHSLNEFIGKGKWVVLNIWATACPYCRDELDDLIDFHERHAEKDAIVIGLTVDWPSFGFPDKEYLANFALDYFIDYPLLMIDQELASQVVGKDVNMIPLTFFYNPEGTLVYRLNGVVTKKTLEKIINSKDLSYSEEWAKQIPPEFEPK